MCKKTLLNKLFIILAMVLHISIINAVAQNEKQWLEPALNNLLNFTDVSCSFSTVYYYRNLINREALTQKEKQTLLSFGDVETMKNLKVKANNMDIGLEGYQVDLTSFSAEYPFITLLNSRSEIGHYVVTQKNPYRDGEWVITDWPRSRYVITSNDLQDKSKGFVLLPAQPLEVQWEDAVIVVDENAIDFDEHPRGKQLHAVFELTNYGNKPLQIKTVEGTCQCTSIVLNNHTIEPGAIEPLMVTIDTLNSFKEWTQYIFIETNDEAISISQHQRHIEIGS